MRLFNLRGKRFGRLTVPRQAKPQRKNGKTYWPCLCDCGSEVIVEGYSLRKGNTRSCGCLRVETSRRQRHDYTGFRFDRWIVLKPAPNHGRRTYWLCRCDCGKEKEVRTENLVSGQSKSCGCLRVDTTVERSLKHGHARRRARSREWQAWRNAINRCYYPKAVNFEDYGGRGITMCDRWRYSFAEFLRDMGPCPPGFTLDRIDVNGNYEPGNCRWAPQSVQARNRRNNRFVNLAGRLTIVTDFAHELGVWPTRVTRMLNRGCTPLDIYDRIEWENVEQGLHLMRKALEIFANPEPTGEMLFPRHWQGRAK